MNDTLSQHTLLARLRLPEADTQNLSFCNSPTPKHIEQWIESLPLTRINFVSSILYSALPELARLKTDGENHLKLLEIVRPVVQSCIGGLAHTFINQPLILPTHALKAATVAQALQKHLSNAYLGALRDCIASDTKAELVALAIHRALTGFGLLLLRSYQLYTPALNQLWVEIHTLYLLAEKRGLHQLPLSDPLNGNKGVKTIEQAYLRNILLTIARPNQLRQQDMADIYNSLELLSAQAAIEPYQRAHDSNLHVVMLDSNTPPVYRSRLALFDSKHIREVRVTHLLQTLGNGKNLKQATGLSPVLATHLIDAYSKPAQRVFERNEGNGELEVTIGLTNVHFHSAEGVPFALFLKVPDSPGYEGEQAGIFKKHGLQLKDRSPSAEQDPWGQAFDVKRPGLQGEGRSTQEIEDSIRRDALARYRGEHPIVTLDIIDTSASGYGLQLTEQTSLTLKSGDILGVREPGRLKWAIAAVRWVRRGKTATNIGIQVLAPQATAAAAAVVQKTGDTAEFQRALILPALRMVGQPETLITNAVSFQELHKIKLHRNGKVTNAQLTRRLFTTGSFSQFTFKELASVNQPEKAQHTPNPFDLQTLWQK